MNAHPRWPLVSTSFTSVPKETIDQAKTLADREGLPLWEFYVKAIEALQADIEKGGDIPWPASRGPGGSPYGVRLPEQTVSAIRKISNAHRVKRTTVFLFALSRYISREGQPTEHQPP
jgi:hypothetical protein